MDDEGQEQDKPPAEQAIQSGDFWNRLYPAPNKVKTEDQEKAYLKSLQHKLEHEKVLLNNIRGDNKDLRVRITSMRFEINYAIESIKKMEDAIGKLKDISRSANKQAFNANTQASETNNQILSLKCKHEDGKEKFEKNVGDL